MDAQRKLIVQLIYRFNERLNCGIDIASFQSDALFCQNVASIIKLSSHRSADILATLASLVSEFNENELPSAKTLQTQLFIIRLIAHCLAACWNVPRQNSDSPKLSFRVQPGSSQNNYPALETSLIDPTPLDEQLSRLLLSISTRYFVTTVTTLNPDTISHNSFANFMAFQTYTDFQGFIPASSTSGSVFPPYSISINTASFFISNEFSTSHNTLNPDLFEIPTSAVELLPEIQKSAARILFFLSSSNWPIVFQRIRQRLFHLGQSSNQGSVESSANERETSDLTDLRLLEWCNLNRVRLGMVLAEVCFPFQPLAL